jgi:hypothetical protein
MAVVVSQVSLVARLPSAMVLASTAIAYPHHPAYAQVSVPTSPAGTMAQTQLPHVFRTDFNTARPPSAFAQVTGLRPKTELTDSATQFGHPPGI